MTDTGPGDAPPIRLPRGPSGIESFRVEGCLGTEAVHAQWDGQWVRASATLREHAVLAMAVEQAFAEADFSLSRHVAKASSPEALMLAMVVCCDQIDLVDYEIGGRRRVIRAY